MSAESTGGQATSVWEKRLLATRRKSPSKEPTVTTHEPVADEFRTQIERDFDRILFSTPLRRLADKTQVFPLDKNDSVRNRLTHSYEVSNLARSFGVALCYSANSPFAGINNAERDVPALLAAVGLAHDLGNPPFGHQGEGAIQRWFSDNDNKFGITSTRDKELFKDFRLFEGNAQGFRLVTRLQILTDIYGLNLTHATLAALMKYPTSSNLLNTDEVAKKKHGYFRSEEEIALDVLEKVGLAQGKRHAIAYVMEACDDIAYVVLDAEDSIKKGLASFADLIAYLRHKGGKDPLVKKVADDSEKTHNEYRSHADKLSAAELNDISMQMFRVYAISAMIREATTTFVEQGASFLSGEQKKPLLEVSNAEVLRKTLKSFSFTHGYTHKTVLALELEGYNTINGLMDMLWFAIDAMAEKSPDDQKNEHPFARYVYSRISENYRRVFDAGLTGFPSWYRKCQLLTDMVSGMTDSYALNLYKELKNLQGECDLASGNGKN
jgi:dGTPase